MLIFLSDLEFEIENQPSIEINEDIPYMQYNLTSVIMRYKFIKNLTVSVRS